MNEDWLLGSLQHVSICDIITHVHLVVWSYVLLCIFIAYIGPNALMGYHSAGRYLFVTIWSSIRIILNGLLQCVSRPIHQNLTQNRKKWSPQINPSQINKTNLKKSIGGIRTRALAFKFELPVRRSTSVLCTGLQIFRFQIPTVFINIFSKE